MSWKNVTPMEEIIRFVMLAQSARFTVSELCEQFGISRKTGYKYLARYAADGLPGLAVRSHRPHRFPGRTDEAVEALILAERRLHRTWGPKKLHKVLEVKHGLESPPARSTIAEILRRHGLSERPRRKPGVYVALNDGLTVPTRPNQVWTVDFKGWFLLGNGQRCDPMTVCNFLGPQVRCSRRSARIKASTASSVRPGKRRGRRLRTAQPGPHTPRHVR